MTTTSSTRATTPRPPPPVRREPAAAQRPNAETRQPRVDTQAQGQVDKPTQNLLNGQSSFEAGGARA
ncbi:MAG TPA: hypothetical protein VD972_22400, partial [Hyalangium sp.]|nr:hypothetical protein [Hyalangium sp.]